MKYKVGEKVIVKSLSQLRQMCVDEDFEDLLFNYDSFIKDEMGKLCEKVVTIAEVSHSTEYNKTVYYIDEDYENYSWYEDWFLPITKAGKVLYGDK